MTRYLTVEYETGGTLVIEGFGPHTISGAVRDILEGNYPEEGSASVKSITISAEKV